MKFAQLTTDYNKRSHLSNIKALS